MGGFRHVVCGISGGVDSAVAAYLLKQRGFRVTGLFMKNWDTQDETTRCTGVNDLEDARSVCRQLGIELLEVSFVREYWLDVFSSLLSDYENGLTPNPDVNCNRYIKFGAFYRYAIEKLGADAISTGHYARTSFGPFLESYQPNKDIHLLRALDTSKDQTLFLSQVLQEPLRRTMFPLGSWFKSQVRQVALEANLKSVYKKRDSTGICFIGKRRFTDFIHEYLPDSRGPFVTLDNSRVIGWHRGVHHWTIGQSCRIGGSPSRYYVAERDPKTQTIFVTTGKYHPALLSNQVKTVRPHWIATPPPGLAQASESTPFYCMFKFQHTEWTVPCRLWPMDHGDGGLTVQLGLPTRAVTPGQFAVFYLNNVCLGSAKIMSKSFTT